MERHPRGILALLSVALCALVLVCWVASHRRPARTLRVGPAPAGERYLLCGAGGLYFVTQEVGQSTDGSWKAQITDYGDVTVRFSSSIASGRMYPASYGVGVGRPHVFTFTLYAGPGANAACLITYRAIGLPFWLLAIVTALPPTAWLVGHQRRRRRESPRGLCRRCGYDLRATPGRCPECGLLA